MSVFHQNILAGASGAAGGASGPLYVDDVFSTFLYEGTSAAQTITNGIDLDGEGGMVWIKTRGVNDEPTVFDTERGAGKYIMSHSTSAEQTQTEQLSSFNSNGFSLGSANQTNRDNNIMCSWTFRKAPGFFDVVTYAGNGTAGRTISHNLGSVPGFVMIKSTSHSTGWYCYHRSVGNDRYVQLNSDEAQSNSGFGIWNTTDPTSTEFTLGGGGWNVNKSGYNYVAYFFAHDDQSFGTGGDEAIIKCGSYTGSGSESTEIDLGFEPQWLLIKNISTSSTDWMLVDMIRGLPIERDSTIIHPNLNNAEDTDRRVAHLTPTGFKLGQPTTDVNGNGNDYIYIAIRRPHKPPEAATDVFATDSQNSGPYNADPYYRSGFVVDAQLLLYKTGTSSAFPWISARLTGKQNLVTALNSAEDNNSTINKWDYMNGFSGGEIFSDDANHVSHMFRRAPGFFDVITYNGSASDQNLPHNLSAIPEFAMFKRRANAGDWICYHEAIGNTKHVTLHEGNAATTFGDMFASTSPTATQFTVNGGRSAISNSGDTYIAYLFATLSGISKVGSYTGTGSNVGVDCGFTAGARFVLIKRTDSTGDWYVFDSHRGIVGGNDPYLLLNDNAAEVTNTDYIDPLNAGFTVTSSAPADLNASGGTYIFLAIA